MRVAGSSGVSPLFFRTGSSWQYVAPSCASFSEWQGTTYVTCAVQVIDMPLLFETKSEWLFRDIIVVTCDHEQQLQRLSHRDGISEEAAIARVRAQMPQAYKAAHAGILIDNSGSITNTRQQVRPLQRIGSELSPQCSETFDCSTWE